MAEKESFLKTFLKGFAIGTSDIIPGVSGGTMAVVLGIYHNLINALKSFNWKWLKAMISFQWRKAFDIPHFPFLLPLSLGAFSALLFFTQIIVLTDLLKTYPSFIYSVFFGLVSGSTIVILRKTQLKYWKDTTIPILTGLIVGFVVLTGVPSSTPDNGWFLYISGLLAGSAMITPGISGAFVLILLGKYEFILEAFSNFELENLTPFVLGIVTALVFFVRLISLLLEKYERKALSLISGFLAASLWKMWPFQSRSYEYISEQLVLVSEPIQPEYDLNFFCCILLIATCTTLVIKIDNASKNILQEEENNENRKA